MMENAVSKRQAAGDDGRHFISTVLLPGAHNKAIALLAHDEPLYGLECQESVRILSRLFLAFLTLSFLDANDRVVRAVETVVERMRIETAL